MDVPFSLREPMARDARDAASSITGASLEPEQTACSQVTTGTLDRGYCLAMCIIIWGQDLHNDTCSSSPSPVGLQDEQEQWTKMKIRQGWMNVQECAWWTWRW